ncbi:MAG: Phosphatidylinositol-4-phosphate 5-kinase [Bathelium mastoideum]|nr:MAG: Phosphatidylinositol-4-phosphate 5-kinase [Bathelium mastoideum]
MPSFASDEPADRTSLASSISAFGYYPRESIDKLTFSNRTSTRQSKTLPNGDGARPDSTVLNGTTDGSVQTLPNGHASGSTYVDGGDTSPSHQSSSQSASTAQTSSVGRDMVNGDGAVENTVLAREQQAKDGLKRLPMGRSSTGQDGSTALVNGDGAAELSPSTTASSPTNATQPGLKAGHGRSASALQPDRTSSESALNTPGGTEKHHRVSSPPAFRDPKDPMSAAPVNPTIAALQGSPHNRLQHRHTLEVPKVNTTRLSRETQGTDDGVSTGRFSPATPTRRRASLTLARRATRSIHSQINLDEFAQDEDALRWAEHIRQKRASKRKRKEDEDDDRVLVGTRVDQNHANFVMAYNMLTGIRFTVSRCNAKVDRDLVDADFQTSQKFSFDVTGNELTPSAKYDFKFKDYAPWVFRHLRRTFKIDPADYLMSLTSKYILSELGSPGKSGSFFYFSRDYKYIIKTIHHAEHKFLRKILKEYYQHVQDNPNTLLSQFYGLHRMKMPYGRKTHFVVMNNLFPPHRDIHRTFDLKGSTIGRDFREEELEKNPRATLKDLNWLRRDLHLEFGPTKKNTFVEQIQRDVALLQKLKIMDYSLLVGIHDLERGNEENIRNKTLKVFQPGGEDPEDDAQQAQALQQQGSDPSQRGSASLQHVPSMLTRTPSKMESARKAKELRQIIKNQKPVPMDQTASKMPEEVLESKKGFYFYQDDGGFRATHEDDRPGEEIYYLGVIDCLTHYDIVKRTEHFWKGLSNPKSQISAIPPEPYGERFIRFISGITKTREAAEADKHHADATQHQTHPDAAAAAADTTTTTPNEHHLPRSALIDGSSSSSPPAKPLPADDARTGGSHRATSTTMTPTQHQSPQTERVMERAEREAAKSQRAGAREDDVPERRLVAVRSPSADRADGYHTGTTLPVVEEVSGEGGSTGGGSRERERRRERHGYGEEDGNDDDSEGEGPRRRRRRADTEGGNEDEVGPTPPPKEEDDGTGGGFFAKGAASGGSTRGRPTSTATTMTSLAERQKPLPAAPPPMIADNYTASPQPARFRKSGDFEDLEMRVHRVDEGSPSVY